MSEPKKIEILIAQDGSSMQVLAHNFHGSGCQEVAEALQMGKVTELVATAEFYQSEEQQNLQTQKQ